MVVVTLHDPLFHSRSAVETTHKNTMEQSLFRTAAEQLLGMGERLETEAGSPNNLLQTLVNVLTGRIQELMQKLLDLPQGTSCLDKKHNRNLGRARKGALTSRLLGLLVFASLLGVLAAGPLPARPRVQGGGRAEQGQAHSLTCVVEGPGTDIISSYVWYKDGDIIREETKQALTFPRLTPGDAAMYQCRLILADRPQILLLSEPVQLIVTGLAASLLPASVRVQGGGRAEQGQAYSLTCVVEGLPVTDTTSSYIWYKDSDIIREETQQVLTFPRLTSGDAGNYQCGPKLSDRPQSLLSETFQLHVLGTYEVMPKPLLSMEGLPVLHQPFKLLCMQFDFPEHTAHIRLSHTWYKDNREIPGQSGAELQFDSLTREDRGVYTCTAKNGRNETTSPKSNRKDLLVLLPPRVHIEPATPDAVIKHAAGEELTLTCNVTEALPWVPADGYSWSYLPSHQGLRRPLVWRESTLRLGPLTREDSGQYFCQARNDLEVFQGQIPPGNASVTVDVVYLGNITLTPDLKANEGEHVTLTCSVESNPPARLAWMVDGEEVRHVTANTDHYLLQRAACSDSKTYTCRASNTDLPGLERHASTSVRVTCNDRVADPPSPPPSPSSSTQDDQEAGRYLSQQSWQWGLMGALAAALAIALVVVTIRLYKMHRKQRERDREDAEAEIPPHQNSAGTASSSDSWQTARERQGGCSDSDTSSSELCRDCLLLRQRSSGGSCKT